MDRTVVDIMLRAGHKQLRTSCIHQHVLKSSDSGEATIYTTFYVTLNLFFELNKLTNIWHLLNILVLMQPVILINQYVTTFGIYHALYLHLLFYMDSGPITDPKMYAQIYLSLALVALLNTIQTSLQQKSHINYQSLKIPCE